jgi:glutathione peroxidase
MRPGKLKSNFIIRLLFFMMAANFGSGEVMAEEDIFAVELRTISGETKTLQDYRAKAILVVNTASKCGFTPQYKGLQSLYDRFNLKGLEILAFPSNDFGRQEPGSNQEISYFCENTYGVTFPLFEKTPVTGANIHPLFRQIHNLYAGSDKGAVRWNFEKFLISGDGTVVQRFRSRVSPTDPQVIAAITKLLQVEEEG